MQCCATLPFVTFTLRLVFALALLLAWFAAPPAQTQSSPAMRWWKGNLHTHTINSDGDSAPDAVARWYKEHRYDFLALTDHNYLTDPQGLNTIFGAKDRFLLIHGEEVTSRYEKKAIHVNAFGVRQTLEPAFKDGMVATTQANVDLIRKAGALPSLNHPNFVWSYTVDEFVEIDDLPLFEVFNGHPMTNDFGGARPSLEQMWDAVLTAGKRRFGIAVDDAHVFKRLRPEDSNPGRGWVEVRAPELTETAILAALENGDFYSSTGVKLNDVSRAGKTLRLEIEENGFASYQVRFMGRDGKLLARTSGPKAEYTLKSGDAYARAVVEDSNGFFAWTQPVFE